MIYEPLKDLEPENSQQATPGQTPEFPSDSFEPSAREERLSALMLEVFNGDVGRGRSLRYWENLKLKPVHIQMIVMKAAGYTQREIARRFQYTEARVSVVVNHPDAMLILGRLVSYQAENLLDIKARIQAHAGEALDTVLHAMRVEEKPAARAEIGFKLLDRAGYGAVERKEIVNRFEMPAAQAEALTSALRESEEVEADYEVLTTADGLAGGSGVPQDARAVEAVDATPDSGEPPVSGQLVQLRQRTA